MTREEHLEWCRARALEYVAMNDLPNAVNSMLSDLTKHPETIRHPAIRVATTLIMNGSMETKAQVETWINNVK